MDVEMSLLREENLELVMGWRMRPDITKFMNTDPVLTVEKQKQWFRGIKHSETQKNWIINYEKMPIGLINIFDIDKCNSRCSWGYYIAETKYRSLKLAMYLEWNLYDYVFDVLSLHKLCNETFVENKQVVKLHIMCGSKEEGVMRDHICKNGIYYDVSIGSIISDEWYAKRENVTYEKFRFE